jgi:hypothetical protein
MDQREKFKAAIIAMTLIYWAQRRNREMIIAVLRETAGELEDDQRPVVRKDWKGKMEERSEPGNAAGEGRDASARTSPPAGSQSDGGNL